MSKGLQNILFLDIETVGITYNYDELSERLKTQWARKAAFIKRDSDMTDEELFVQRAGIYAEFGKIVTLGLGYFTTEDDTLTFVLRPFITTMKKSCSSVSVSFWRRSTKMTWSYAPITGGSLISRT